MIAIVDYGMGNLRSVQKAFERLGIEAQVTSDPQQVAEADRLVLPGVGAFRDAIAELHTRSLIEPLQDAVRRDKPFLGICLGMQLLMDTSYEDGEYEGLAVIPGTVRKFDLAAEYHVPHMGWNDPRQVRPHPLLEDIPDHSYFYFVHSYYVCPNDQDTVVLEADYGGPFCAMLARGQLLATQFHPEKSQKHGLQLLRNFAKKRG